MTLGEPPRIERRRWSLPPPRTRRPAHGSPGPTGRGPLPSSNRHDDKDTGGIAGLTSGTGEKNVDAYTKIAGEGARWQCVRKHASKLKNDSRFFTANPADDQTVFAIPFKTLWLNWKTGFHNKYDIPR